MSERRGCIVLVGAPEAIAGCRARLEALGHPVDAASTEGGALTLLRGTPAEAVVVVGPALTEGFADSLRVTQPGRLLPVLLLGDGPPVPHVEAQATSEDELVPMLARALALRARVDALVGELRAPGAGVALTEIQSAVAEELRRAHRYDDPLGLVLLELDGEPLLRGRLGASGVQALGDSLGETIARCARATDRQSRLGVTRFALLLPRTPLAGALTVAERVVREVAALPPRIVTCSVGLAMLPTGSLLTAPELWALADKALQEARGQGGGRVCLAPTE